MPYANATPLTTALTLTPLQSLPPSQKTALLASIANDIKSTLIYIAKQSEAGNLDTTHTAPLNDLVATIKNTAVRERRVLERRLERAERRVRRLRGEREWMRREFGGVVRRVGVVGGRWRERVRGLRKVVEGLRGELEGRKREVVKGKENGA